MATKTGQTALSTAMKGGKVTERQAQSALGQAVTKIANLTKKAESSKEAMMETGTLVLHTAETQGSLFLASMAEGYLGEDKLKMGSVDVRAPVGLIAQGYGLYQTMSGQKGAGAHVLAIGNGVMGSWLATVARNAGRTLAEKKAGVGQAPVQPAAVAPAPTAITMQGHPMLAGPSLLPEPLLAGPPREVLLTPSETTEGEDDDFGRRGRGMRGRRRMRRGGGRPMRGRGGGRFVRAQLDEDGDEDAET
jgi:hypothetical protein